ncbi:MAG: hypothetical protein ACOCSQ_05200, partial [Planctomycetota bacterium]
PLSVLIYGALTTREIYGLGSVFGMNFTGASTCTSLSGVRREMRVAVPLQVGAALCASVLWTLG